MPPKMRASVLAMLDGVSGADSTARAPQKPRGRRPVPEGVNPDKERRDDDAIRWDLAVNIQKAEAKI